MAPTAPATRARVGHPARDLCLAPGRTIDAPVVEGGRYGRMFSDLPAPTFDDDRLLALGVDGGICDGGLGNADGHVEAGQIGDPRNDVHAFMTGLQVAFIRAHNHLVDRLRADGVAESDLFEDARRALVWHYQWVILNDFLPTLVGAQLTAAMLTDGPRFYRPRGEPFIPVEFADAAYRYGHSQIKEDYQLREGGRRFPVFPDLAGFRPLASE